MAARKVTGVITGSIVHQSSTVQSRFWLPKLKKALSSAGKSHRTWQIFRGDSFQVEVKQASASLLTAIHIKASIKTIRDLDVRMAIGIGEKKYSGSRIADAHGEAFVNSAEKFETLRREKEMLALRTPWRDFDREMNICLRLASIPMDAWTPNSAELVLLRITHKKLTQKTLARKLRITQPSVSERQARSHYEDIIALEELYREKINGLIS